ERSREVLAPPRIAAPGRSVIRRGERFEAALVPNLLQRRDKGDWQPLRAEQAVAQIVQRETAVARGERLMDGPPHRAPFFAPRGVALALFARAQMIDETLELGKARLRAVRDQ